jgi:hypothetical protein
MSRSSGAWKPSALMAMNEKKLRIGVNSFVAEVGDRVARSARDALG